MKKFSKIGLIIEIIILFLGASSIKSINVNFSVDDQLDQSQTIRTGSIGSLEMGVAQTFKPTVNRLTRVEIYAEKIGNPTGGIWISIRESLEGDNIEYRILEAQDILKTGDWYEIDFSDDILVEPEQTYFLVWTPYYIDADDENMAFWGCNWYDNIYTRGEMWKEYPEDNWYIEDPDWDCCFKTYGLNSENYPPEPPAINGPKSGRPGHTLSYTFLTVDPNGDDVKYEVDWGDGEIKHWSIAYESDELASFSHTWNERGNFTIKARAKDIYGAVGSWSIYEMTIPRDKAVCNPILISLSRFINNFPILKLILQRLGK
jgi:hypothetical protein